MILPLRDPRADEMETAGAKRPWSGILFSRRRGAFSRAFGDFLRLLAAGGVLALLLAAVPVSAPVEPLPASTWNDTTRDVYVDGALDLHLRTLRASSGGWMLVVAEGWNALPAVREEEGRLESIEIPSNTLTWDDAHLTATTTPLTPRPLAPPPAKDETGAIVFRHAGHLLRIARHPGISGPVTVEEIFEDVPVWRTLEKIYQPDAKAVQALGRIDRPVALTVALGTWCGDSKEYVPHLLKTLELAGNEKISVRFVALRRGFRDRPGFAEDYGISRVPTVIVEREGEEVGRFVETPTGETIEGDLAAILLSQGKSREGAEPGG